MKNLKWAILALAIVPVACAKQAKPTPAPAPAAANPAQLTVRVRVSKSDLKYDQAAFNRAAKHLKNAKGTLLTGTANARLTADTVFIDLSVPYTAGAATNLGSLRYFINNPDAGQTATSTPFIVDIKPEQVTNNIVTTPLYKVTWRHTFSGK